MPIPCTTKVSFSRTCPNYIKFVGMMYEIHHTLPLKRGKKAVDVAVDVAVDAASAVILPILSEQQNKNNRKSNPNGKGQRLAIWNKYFGEDVLKHLCLCCKTTHITKTDFEVGHVISKANGGDDSPANKRPICFDCNRSMNSMNMDEYVKQNQYYFG